VVVLPRACSIAAPCSPITFGGGDYKDRAGARGNELGNPAKRAPLDNRVIGALRGLDAETGHIRSLYHGPVAPSERFPVSAVPVLCEGFAMAILAWLQTLRNSRLRPG